MMNTIGIISTLLIALAAFNIVRLTFYAIASSLQTIREHRHRVATRGIYYRPSVSVIVPAHNEGLVIERTLQSLLASDYPKSRLEIIVANDGSTDDTAKRVRSFAARNRKQATIRLVSLSNRGKAEALNYAIRKRAKGSLIMCLDADSLVHKDCIKNSVRHFRKSDVVAVASNVNIIEDGTLLGLMQRFEYLFSHHFKKAHSLVSMEYIIGGVGSTFRHSIMKQVHYYDSDTMTEDIDLTLKIIRLGNKKHRVVFASDAITYTEPVQTYGALINQRFRWKFGRLQSFYKNRHLFFSSDTRYTKQLTMVLLPLTVMYEIFMLLEPLIVAYIFYMCLSSGSITSILWAAITFVVLLTMNIWASDHISKTDRLRLTAYAPAMYFVMYGLVFVDYMAGLKSAMRLHMLVQSVSTSRITWVSPVRNSDIGV